MRVKNREKKAERKKDAREPSGDFGQNVRGLRAENIFRDAAAESRAEAFTFRPLHQDDENHQERVDGEEN